ncbi:hypothetical protein NUKP37_28130 [Klebsiella variicola]|uniref:Uncharacterized protein n=1 Tax=Klebsiella variicola TaxID=244366 RepID=A0A9P3P7J8_KLEVA|nr:hypothetical protein [Klebsiella variicola]ART08165.1 hypothetical protein B8O08_26270 [Klebsiella variicola]MEC5996287.1 hypothetical protein [Klebsiella variicola]GKJ94834.1 hypothetical protein NUKP37_28130 [Klebsiella variicola]
MAARGEGAILLTGGMFATQPHTISNLPRPSLASGSHRLDVRKKRHPSLAFPVTSDQDTTIFMEAM